MNKSLLFLSLVVSSFLYACSSGENNTVETKTTKAKYVVSKVEAKLWLKSNQLFKPLPDIKIDSTEENLAKLKMGKMLYFDTRLSKNGNISCNSCHNMETYGVDNEPTSPGTDKIRGGRNSPTSLNAFLHIAQFWDGRAKDVEAQAQGPILNSVEMGMPHKQLVIDRIAGAPSYISLYRKAYPTAAAMTYENLTASIGYFERTMVTHSRFDKFLKNDFEALTIQEKEGLKIFIEKGCPTCHMGVTMGGTMYEKFGKFGNYWEQTKSVKIDNGIYDLTKDENDKYKFKVPSLRNITETYPYFHDGSVRGLKTAVVIMAKVQLDKEITEKEANAIVAFLGSLKGEVPLKARNL
jgi:cytochrome c peroxidase